MNSFDWTRFFFWLITISTLHVTVIGMVVLCLVRLTQRKQPAVAHSIICGGVLCFLLIPVAVLSLHDRSWQTLGGGDAQSMEITSQIKNEDLNKNASTAQLHSPPPTESIDPISPARPDREVLDAVANAPSTKNEHPKRRQAVVAKLNLIPYLQGLAASPLPCSSRWYYSPFSLEPCFFPSNLHWPWYGLCKSRRVPLQHQAKSSLSPTSMQCNLEFAISKCWFPAKYNARCCGGSAMRQLFCQSIVNFGATPSCVWFSRTSSHTLVAETT